MSAIRQEYGDGLAGELWDFTHEICRAEAGLTLSLEVDTEWIADTAIFPAVFALRRVNIRNHFKGPEGITVARFLLDIEGETVELDLGKPVTLDGDPTAEYLLTQAKTIYDAHDHGICKSVYGPQVIPDDEKIPATRMNYGNRSTAP